MALIETARTYQRRVWDYETGAISPNMSGIWFDIAQVLRRLLVSNIKPKGHIDLIVTIS